MKISIPGLRYVAVVLDDEGASRYRITLRCPKSIDVLLFDPQQFERFDSEGAAGYQDLPRLQFLEDVSEVETVWDASRGSVLVAVNAYEDRAVRVTYEIAPRTKMERSEGGSARLLEMETTLTDLFLYLDGVKIASRGHPDTPQAGKWVPLSEGWEIIDIVENGQSAIEVKAGGRVVVGGSAGIH